MYNEWLDERSTIIIEKMSGYTIFLETWLHTKGNTSYSVAKKEDLITPFTNNPRYALSKSIARFILETLISDDTRFTSRSEAYQAYLDYKDA